MEDRIVICDRETVFVQILADYLRKKFKTGLEVQAFDHVEKFLAFVKSERASLCLVGDGILDSYQLQDLLTGTEHVVCLSGKKKKGTIFKYQSVERVIGDLLKYCAEENIAILQDTDYLLRRERMKIIAFHAPVHHILQSTLALTMGQRIAREKKVLYLNFEPFSAFDYLLQRTYEQDLMDLFFFLKEDRAKFRLKVESMMEHIGNLDYIPPVFCYPDMEDIDVAQWQNLLQRIINEMDYDVLILDLTEHTKGLFSMLEMCDEIYMCLPDEGLAVAKADQYERLLVHMRKEDILERTTRSIVPVFHDIPLSNAMFTHAELNRYIAGLQKEETDERL